MFFGSNLDDLPPPEHVWDLLAAAGGSPMVQSVIFDGFWLPSWVPLGPLFGYFWEKGIVFLQAVLQVPFGEAPGLVLVSKKRWKSSFFGDPGYAPNIVNNVRI
jgi:hypothetical protein